MLVDQIFQEVVREAQSNVNRFFAWRALRHEPNDEELMRHFLENGGEEYVKRRLNIPRQITSEDFRFFRW
ncbi:MAG: hypothetical protein WCS89_03635 [Candidatus Paceibacterota bacterium]|jgi:hypothetical protein